VRIRNVSFLLILVALGINSCHDSRQKREIQKPNIILIMADDLGWFDVGFNGNTEVKTPNLDLLASHGIIFDRFYSASAVCSPTRASVITGRNPLRINIPYANAGHVKEKEITLPEILKNAAYVTGHFGKWHLGTLTTSVRDANRGGRSEFDQHYTIPTEHGYDVFFCTESKVPTYDPMLYPNRFKEGESMRFGWRAVPDKDSTHAYGTAYWIGENEQEVKNLRGDDSRIIMDRVIPFMDNALKQHKAFFTTIWFHTPHLPVVSDSIHRSYYEALDLSRQLYYGSITAMDEQMGRLWEKIKEHGIQENTILFFCSDNGPERATPGSAGIFRERKRSLYEGGVRVPAFVIWPAHLEGSKRTDYPAVTSDYLPTILDILDMEYPSERPLDGISILDALRGSTNERTEAIGFICSPKISRVTDQYKLIGDTSLENFELYDLHNDPSEQKNIIAAYPALAEQMKMELLEWLKSVENSKRGMDYSH
jgi:arylsulfatase A-like enzyme